MLLAAEVDVVVGREQTSNEPQWNFEGEPACVDRYGDRVLVETNLVLPKERGRGGRRGPFKL